MIYAVKSVCKIKEYFSNIHFFWLVDLNRIFVGLKAAFSVVISFQKPNYSETSM
jgi:hypothetical protein